MKTIKKTTNAQVIAWAVMMIIGFIFLIFSLTIDVPSQKLTKLQNGEYLVENYIANGDEYNYIIASNAVGSEYVAAKTEKAIYASSGVFMLTLGFAMLLNSITDLKVTEQNKKQKVIPQEGEKETTSTKEE